MYFQPKGENTKQEKRLFLLASAEFIAMRILELLEVNCHELSGLSGFDIQKKFEKPDQFMLLTVKYPELSIRTMLLLAPAMQVIRFFFPTFSETFEDEQDLLLREYNKNVVQLFASVGIRKRSLAPFSSIFQDTIFENVDWPIPESIDRSYVHEGMVDDFSNYVADWISQLSDWVICPVEPEVFSSPGWYFDQIDKFLADKRFMVYSNPWTASLDKGWMEQTNVINSMAEEVSALHHGDSSLVQRLLKSPVFTMRDLDRYSLVRSLSPSRRMRVETRHCQTLNDVISRYDECLLLRSKLISEVKSPLSYIFAKQFIDGIAKSFVLSREHASESAEESMRILQMYREAQEASYPILKRVFGA